MQVQIMPPAEDEITGGITYAATGCAAQSSRRATTSRASDSDEVRPGDSIPNI
jgi:hypothetical protein